MSAQTLKSAPPAPLPKLKAEEGKLVRLTSAWWLLSPENVRERTKRLLSQVQAKIKQTEPTFRNAEPLVDRSINEFKPAGGC